jgi:hypothetical protein
MPDPEEFFSNIKRLMSSNGELLLLTPIANSIAWKIFRENWIQADAPRHLNIPSLAAIEILAKKYNFVVTKKYFNGTEFQIVGSKQCREGISLMSPRSVYSGQIANRVTLVLTRIRLWRQIQNWNKREMSDQAVFFLRNRR